MINGFRVFISSTFSDLVDARRRLADDVFPIVEAHCRARGVAFEAIDLRWGVSAEAAANQNAMRICLDELDKCVGAGVRPALIVLLGDRYGWRPIPHSIDASVFDRVLASDSSAPARALLSHWYVRDDNAVPPRVVLREREGDDLVLEHWAKSEAPMWKALHDAAETEGLDALNPDLLSATHQEIHRALTTDGGDTITVVGLRDAEVIPADVGAVREQLRAAAGARCFDFPAGEAGLDVLVREATARLIADIDAALETARAEGPLVREVAAHQRFGRDRRALWVGRTEERALLGRAIAGADLAPIFVSGPGGVGKTALMAVAADDVRAAAPAALVVERYVGATPGSSDIDALVTGIADEIIEALGGDADASERLFEAASARLRRGLALAREDRRIVIFLDGVDQLDLSLRSPIWDVLLIAWPAHVRLVVSAASGAGAEALTARLTSATPVTLSALPAQDNCEMLAQMLGRDGRRLTEAQWAAVRASLPAEATPLFMRLLFHDARHWRSDEPPPAAMPQNIDDLLRLIIERLRDAGHTPVLVSRALFYLAVSRFGLSESELLQALFDDPDVRVEFFAAHPNSPATRALPIVIWARLKAQLGFLLREVEVGGSRLYSFYHRIIDERVEGALATTEQAPKRVAALAAHFAAIAHGADTPEARRKCAELPYLLAIARRPAELTALLSDYSFLIAKCRANRAADLLHDFDRADPLLDDAQRTALAPSYAFLRRAQNMLRRGRPGWPADRIFLQLTAERAVGDPLRGAADAFLAAGGGQWLWLRRAWDSEDDALAVLDGHEGPIRGFTQREGEGLSWSMDGTVRRWRLIDGECLNVYPTESEPPRGAVALGDAIVGWTQGALYVWRRADERLLLKQSVAPGDEEWVFVAPLASDRALALARSGAVYDIAVSAGAAVARQVVAPAPVVITGPQKLVRLSDHTALRIHNGGALFIDVRNGEARELEKIGAIAAEPLQGCAVVSGMACMLSIVRADGSVSIHTEAKRDGRHASPQPWRFLPHGGGLMCLSPSYSETPDAIMNHLHAAILLDARGEVVGEGVFDVGSGATYGAYAARTWRGDGEESARQELRGTTDRKPELLDGAFKADGAIVRGATIILPREGAAADLSARPAHARDERAVEAALLTPDEGLISFRLLGARDGAVYIWDDATGVLKQRLATHEGGESMGLQSLPRVNGVAEMDGLYVSWGYTDEAPLWDAADGEPLRSFRFVTTTRMFSVAFIRDPSTDDVAMAALNSHGRVALWRPYPNIGRELQTGVSGLDYARDYENWLLKEQSGDLIWGYRNLPIQRWSNRRIFDPTQSAPDATYVYTGVDLGQARSMTTASRDAKAQVKSVLTLSRDRLAAVLANGTIEIFEGREQTARGTLRADGAYETAEGALLSWSVKDGCALWGEGEQSTVWRSAAPPLARLSGAAPTNTGDVLTWASDRRYRVYARADGAALREVPELEAVFEAPALVAAHARAVGSARAAKLEWTAWSVDRIVGLSAEAGAAICWHADEPCLVDDLREDGAIAARTQSGKLALLHLYYGGGRVELPPEDAQTFLAASLRSLGPRAERLSRKSRALARLGRPDKAQAALARALELLRPTTGEEAWVQQSTLLRALVVAMWNQGEFEAPKALIADLLARIETEYDADRVPGPALSRAGVDLEMMQHIMSGADVSAGLAEYPPQVHALVLQQVHQLSRELTQPEARRRALDFTLSLTAPHDRAHAPFRFRVAMDLGDLAIEAKDYAAARARAATAAAAIDILDPPNKAQVIVGVESLALRASQGELQAIARLAAALDAWREAGEPPRIVQELGGALQAILLVRTQNPMPDLSVLDEAVDKIVDRFAQGGSDLAAIAAHLANHMMLRLLLPEHDASPELLDLSRTWRSILQNLLVSEARPHERGHVVHGLLNLGVSEAQEALYSGDGRRALAVADEMVALASRIADRATPLAANTFEALMCVRGAVLEGRPEGDEAWQTAWMIAAQGRQRDMIGRPFLNAARRLVSTYAKLGQADRVAARWRSIQEPLFTFGRQTVGFDPIGPALTGMHLDFLLEEARIAEADKLCDDIVARLTAPHDDRRSHYGVCLLGVAATAAAKGPGPMAGAGFRRAVLEAFQAIAAYSPRSAALTLAHARDPILDKPVVWTALTSAAFAHQGAGADADLVRACLACYQAIAIDGAPTVTPPAELVQELAAHRRASLAIARELGLVDVERWLDGAPPPGGGAWPWKFSKRT